MRQLFAKIGVWSITSMFMLTFLFSCEKQPLNEKQTQHEILHDQDFVSMLAEIYIVNYSNKDEGPRSIQEKSLKIFDIYFKILDKKYDNFYNNCHLALSNKRSDEYKEFTKILKENIYVRLSSESAKMNVVYDGASICGKESCGSSNQDNTTLGCLAGASFAEVYCLRNNLGSCSEMRESLIDECCDQFCNPQD